MKRMIKPFSLTLFLCFFILGMGGTNQAKAQQKDDGKTLTGSTHAGQKQNALEEKWELTEMDGEAVADLFPHNHPTIEFKVKENQVAGFAGCNQFHGQLVLDESYIKIVGVGATKKACPLLDEEEEFLAILQEVDQYGVSGKELSLWSNGQLLLKFKKAD
jgi:heat shock protein HslJ